MKKTLNINLGGMAFIIDENAFEILFNYLETLKKKFGNEAERKEILNDIEARIAEIFTEKLGSRKEVVGVEEVQFVIAQMGKPEDIAGEERAAEGTPENTSSAYTYTTNTQSKIHKRLYRDPDDARVGGVIAGLCHYFGINDPTWARLAVVLLCFVSLGTVLLVYLLLLIIVPKANTSTEKLEMKGEPVNISTIEKEIKDAASRAENSLYNIRSNSGSVISRIGSFIIAIVVFFLKLAAVFVGLIGLIILFALIAAVLGISVAGNALLTQAPTLLVDSPSSITLFNAGLFLMIGAPVIGIIYTTLRAVLGTRARAPWLKWVLTIAFWLGVAMVAIPTYKTALEFRTQATKKEQINLMQPANGTLLVELTDSAGNTFSEEQDDNSFHVGFGGVTINGDNLDEVQLIKIGKPELQLMPSANDSFYVEYITTSRGRTKADVAINNASVVYKLAQQDTLLKLPAYLLLDKTKKWRGQKLELRIAVPEGKKVSFAGNIDFWAAIVKGDNSYDQTYFANTTWTTENGKIKCLNCEKQASEEIVIEQHIDKMDKQLQEHEKQLQEKMKQAEEKLKAIEQKLEKKAKKKEGDSDI
jgi:phage shock protein PspC (stress-responsive transcriptional regulator)